MKRRLLTLALAALTIGLLGSCSEINERIDKLESRLNGVENETIASINSQIGSINSSIADLSAIRTSIQNLTSTVEGQKSDLAALEAADEALGGRIDELTDFVNGELANYAKSDWVNATFSTLKQYEETCDTIAKIDARIGALDTKLSQDIANCKDTLTSWINKQFESYYTIAQMDAMMNELKAALDTAKAGTSGNIDSLAAELAATKVAIDTAKAQVTREYEAAIDTAITKLDGKLSKALQEKIDSVNTAIAALEDRVKTLELQVYILAGRVTELENMVQSVAIVPAYSDGSVEADNDSLFIDCIVSPADAVKGLKKDNVKLLINKVRTKAADVVTLSLAAGDIFETDETNGTFFIRVNVSGYIPATADSTITVALNIKSGISDYTTDFLPVYVKQLPAGALAGEFTVAEGKKVHFSKGNLCYVVNGTKWEFYEKQYDFCNTNTYVGHHADTISLFTWGYDATKSIVPNGQVSDNVSITSGNLSQEQDWGCKIGDGNTWRTLTTAEWQYLFNNHVKVWGQCNSVNGYFIAPDGYEGDATALTSAVTDWTSAEAAGIVFLPAAGRRMMATVYSVGSSDGYYWSSSAYSIYNAYCVYFSSGNVNTDSKDNRYNGYSVRLITDVK